MAERPGTSLQTESQTVSADDVDNLPDVKTIKLTLKKTKTEKQVKWTAGTVDNENLNKKKSKCCCIYEKPRKFGESSSDESDGECENCFGHVERRKHKGDGSGESSGDAEGSPPEHPTSN